MRSLLCLILAFFLLLPVMPVQKESPVDFEITVLSQDTCAIKRYWGTETKIVIPGEMGGYRVTAIGKDAFYRCAALESVTLPEGVESIGDWAFAWCDALTQVVMPDSVTHIGNSAFYKCASLKEAALPGALESMDDWAFCGCTALTQLTVPADTAQIGSRAFYGCPDLTLRVTENSPAHAYAVENGLSFAMGGGESAVTAQSGESAGQSHAEKPEIAQTPEKIAADFETAVLTDDTCAITQYIGSADNVVIPEKINGRRVVSIGTEAFYSCSAVERVTLPAGLESIGNKAFSLCTQLADIALPEGLKTIGAEAFSYCHSLREIALPDSLTGMGANPFEHCVYLTRIDVAREHPVFEVVDGVLFDKTTKTLICYPCAFTAGSYSVPAGTKHIADWAFADCKQLTEVTLPAGVESIGGYAFWYCSALERITLAAGVESIGESAFASCASLQEITLPDTCGRIGSFAFSFCNKLKHAVIPAGVTHVGYFAFNNCEALTLTVVENSPAHTYALENNIRFVLK